MIHKFDLATFVKLIKGVNFILASFFLILFSVFVYHSGDNARASSVANSNITNATNGNFCVQVITRACKNPAACLPGGACTNEGPICQDFPTPCDVPEGWFIEGSVPSQDEEAANPAPSLSPGQTPIPNYTQSQTQTKMPGPGYIPTVTYSSFAMKENPASSTGIQCPLNWVQKIIDSAVVCVAQAQQQNQQQNQNNNQNQIINQNVATQGGLGSNSSTGGSDSSSSSTSSSSTSVTINN